MVPRTPAVQDTRTRSAVVLVCRDERSVLGCAKVADGVLTGRVGAMGAPADQWYYAARQHLLFAREADVHANRVSALALPSLPPDVRKRLGERGLALTSVTLLPESIVKAASEPGIKLGAVRACRAAVSSAARLRFLDWSTADQLVFSNTAT